MNFCGKSHWILNHSITGSTFAYVRLIALFNIRSVSRFSGSTKRNYTQLSSPHDIAVTNRSRFAISGTHSHLYLEE